MQRQPKARGTKAAARVRAFAELTSRARDVPQGDTRVAFGGAGMQRQACCGLSVDFCQFPGLMGLISWKYVNTGVALIVQGRLAVPLTGICYAL